MTDNFDAQATAVGVPGDMSFVVSHTFNQETGEVTVHLFEVNSEAVVSSEVVKDSTDSAYYAAVATMLKNLPTWD